MAGTETENTEAPAGDGINQVIETDFKEKTVRKITVTEDTKPSQLLRSCAKWAKENRVKSVMVLMIDEDDDCDWSMEVVSDLHCALMALILEDAKADIKAKLFNEEEVEV